MTTALATIDDDRAQLIRTVTAPAVPNITDDELRLYLTWAARYDLDPLAGHTYAIRTGGRVTWAATIQGLRILAERTGEYAGQEGPWWCGRDGQWSDVWIPPEAGGVPWAARVHILRHGFNAPMSGVAKWSSWAKPNSPTWKAMPDHMLAVRAEALALRRAFPALNLEAGDETDAYDARRRHVHRLLNLHGVTDPDARHDLVAAATGGETDSTKALTGHQAARIIAHLEETP